MVHYIRTALCVAALVLVAACSTQPRSLLASSETQNPYVDGDSRISVTISDYQNLLAAWQKKDAVITVLREFSGVKPEQQVHVTLTCSENPRELLQYTRYTLTGYAEVGTDKNTKPISDSGFGNCLTGQLGTVLAGLKQQLR